MKSSNLAALLLLFIFGIEVQTVCRRNWNQISATRNRWFGWCKDLPGIGGSLRSGRLPGKCDSGDAAGDCQRTEKRFLPQPIRFAFGQLESSGGTNLHRRSVKRISRFRFFVVRARQTLRAAIALVGSRRVFWKGGETRTEPRRNLLSTRTSLCAVQKGDESSFYLNDAKGAPQDAQLALTKTVKNLPKSFHVMLYGYGSSENNWDGVRVTVPK